MTASVHNASAEAFSDSEGAPPDHWRLAAGLTIDDRAGVLQVYVAEAQRGFVIGGVAAEMMLELVASAEAEPLTQAAFVESHVARYDRARLNEAWSASVSGGILVPAGGAVLAAPETSPGLVLLANAHSDIAMTLRRELHDLDVRVADDDDRPSLIVGVDDAGDDHALVELGRSLPRPGVPWLPVQLLHERLSIGPLIFPGDTACFECALTRRAASLMPDGVRRWGRQPVVRPGALDRRAGAKVAAAVIRHQIRSLTRHEPPSLTGRRLTYDLVSATQQTGLVLEVPGCRTCRSTDGLLQ